MASDGKTRPGAGRSWRCSTIQVYLPRTFQPQTHPPPSESVLVHRGSETILVVEDDAHVRTVVVRTLEKAGYQPLESASPTEAIQIASRHEQKIDLLLSDVVMHGMLGAELADVVQELRPGIRVLLMSGYSPAANGRSEVRSRWPSLSRPTSSPVPSALASTTTRVILSVSVAVLPG